MTASSWLHEQFEPTGSSIGFRITRKLDEVQSPFQKIEIFESTDWGNMMLIDGAMMVTTRDNFLYHEMVSHPALFTHPDPKNVVIIGGGDCGTLREVLRHPGVERAVQCDIDEQVTRMAEKYFPELCESNGDPRAQLLFDDGVAYMRDAAPASLDVVIVDSTDPVGPAEGLFNRAFYESCFRALKDDGILVQQSESPLALLDLIREMRAEMGKAGFTRFQTLPFPQPCYPTGWWSCTLARKSGGFDFREDDARNKPFATKYYSAEIHRGAQALPPFVAQALAD
ncbi:polyamine aminopropyltransferase [Luteimonas sp. SDU101]|uniref:polyamine aminopropyltransferase n=1 Tax=Luteimonas sp. SDU101 TaxID=3422593 RepID=UPI003EBE394C